MSNGTSKRNVVAAVLFSLVLASAAGATDYTWNVAGGGNWSTLTNWSPSSAYPAGAGDKAIIWNSLPSAWPGGLQTITIDAAATGINGADLDLRDDDSGSPPVMPNEPSGVTMRLRVEQDATFNRWDWFNDAYGSGRSYVSIAAGKTLSINHVNMTGRFVDGWLGDNKTTAVMRWDPDGAGTARHDYNYQGYAQTYHNITVDHSDVTEMVLNRNGGSAWCEARDTIWKVGNAGGAQTWTTIGGTVAVVDRHVGSPFDIDKVGPYDIDMGVRGGGNPSDGLRFDRGTSGDHGAVHQRHMFTDSAGNQAGGTVTIAGYRWQETSADYTNGNTPWFMWDKFGASVTVNGGGSFTVEGRDSARCEDVDLVRILPGNTLRTEAPGEILIDDSASPLSTGRMGIHFAGAQLDPRGDLRLLGPNTFLNDGGAVSMITVGGNVVIQSANPLGLTGTANGLTDGVTIDHDNFDLRMTVLTMDGGGGGGARTLDWADGVGIGGGLDASDFSLDNFTLAILLVRNGTEVNLLDGEEMFLNANLVIEPGSTLTLADTGAIYLLDTDLSELQRISGYLGTELLNAHVETVRDVGLAVVAGEIVIPEPATAVLLALGTLAVARRRRST